MKRFFCFLFIGCVLAYTSGISFSAYSGGLGTLSDPYQIADVNDLLYLSAHIDDYDNAFRLTADIDLAGYSFNAALIAPDVGGSGGETFEGVTFKGVFDGDGHVVRNFRIDDVYAADYLGLFGYAQNATIKNLGLENVVIVPTAYDFQSVYRGCLVGIQESGAIENCHVIGSLTGGRYYIGGITGYSSGIIHRCFADISINPNQWGSSNIGGIVGKLEGGTLSSSYSRGSIQQGSGNANMGGLIGFVGAEAAGFVRNCYSHCSVIGDTGVGGCIGRIQNASAVVENCYATGVVQGRQSYGGFLGQLISGTVTNCFWDRQTSGVFSQSAAGTPLYTYQMKTRSTFTNAGWDFVDVWSICGVTNYPRLTWQIPAGDWVCPDGVTLADFAFLAQRWMMNDCGSNSACDGADLDLSDAVDLPDLLRWLEQWTQNP
ncbi:MAG: hypothetical protein L0Y36_01315 [Planctomycetales bacterium]|nr:hypothetical protein [Planctomycetales bacterium]